MKETKEIKWTKSGLMYDAYKRWCHSSDTTLHDVYGTFSNAKSKAFNYCYDLMKNFNGEMLAIIGHNTFTFTAGFVFDVMDSNTGAIMKAFCYITPSYDRFLLLGYEGE